MKLEHTASALHCNKWFLKINLKAGSTAEQQTAEKNGYLFMQRNGMHALQKKTLKQQQNKPELINHWYFNSDPLSTARLFLYTTILQLYATSHCLI